MLILNLFPTFQTEFCKSLLSFDQAKFVSEEKKGGGNNAFFSGAKVFHVAEKAKNKRCVMEDVASVSNNTRNLS